jgi:hypothetical protein
METNSGVVILDEGSDEDIEEMTGCCKTTSTKAALRVSTN